MQRLKNQGQNFSGRDDEVDIVDENFAKTGRFFFFRKRGDECMRKIKGTCLGKLFSFWILARQLLSSDELKFRLFFFRLTRKMNSFQFCENLVSFLSHFLLPLHLRNSAAQLNPLYFTCKSNSRIGKYGEVKAKIICRIRQKKGRQKMFPNVEKKSFQQECSAKADTRLLDCNWIRHFFSRFFFVALLFCLSSILLLLTSKSL